MGIMYLDTPIIMGLHRRFPKQARYSTIAGLLIMCLALALSSFSTTVPRTSTSFEPSLPPQPHSILSSNPHPLTSPANPLDLIVTQGILYALGGSIAYAPCIIYLEEWFSARRGLAFGIMWSATGLSGVILPLLLESLLAARGHQTTLRVFACVVFALTAPLSYFVKPRLPIAQARHAKPYSLAFVLSRPFGWFQVFNVVEAVGFFLPGIYLPSFARQVLGAGSLPSVVAMMLVNVASVFGCVAMGHLIDRLEVTRCLLVSTVGATVGTFLFWGLSVNLPVLYVFCVVYGLFAGAYTSAWPGIMKEVTRRGTGEGAEEGSGKAADPSMVFAFLAMGRGVGNVVSGPLSEALIKGMPWKGQAFGGYGSGYGGLIAFTGATAFFGGGSYVWRRLGWL